MLFTFVGVLNFLYNKMQSIYGYAISVLQNGDIGNILQAQAYAIERLGFYDEIVTKEGIFRTAEFRHSVNHHAWALSYRPHRNRGGRTVLTFSADPNYKDHVPGSSFVYLEPNTSIARWTQVNSEDGLVKTYVTKDSAYLKGQITRHYSLPSVGTNPPFTPQATTIDSFGLVKIPVTLVTAVVNPNGASTGNHQITPGMQITIRGTVSFDGDFIVQDYPSYVLSIERPYYIVIQTNYINQIVSETFPVGASISAGHVLVDAKEGEPKELDYIATGIINEKIQIISPTTDSDEIQVLLLNSSDIVIDEARYLSNGSWLVRDLTQYYFTVEDDPQFRFIIIKFGDGIRTRKLPAGQKLKIKYAETLGSTGGSQSLNNLKTIPNQLLSDTGSPVSTLYVTNSIPLPPGEDFEELRDIKERARKQFQDDLLAVSQEGWPAVVRSHPNVLKAVTWNATDINPFTIDATGNVVYIAAVDKNALGINPLSALAQDISFNYLRVKNSKTDFIDWEPCLFIHVKVKITTKVFQINKAAYESRLKNAIVATWGVLEDERIFRKEAYESLVSGIVHNDPDTRYALVDLEYSENSMRSSDLRVNNAFDFKGTYRKSVSSKLDSFIDPNGTSVKFWIKRKLDDITSGWYLIAQQLNSQVFDFNTSDPKYNGYRIGANPAGSNSVTIGASPTAAFYNSTTVNVDNISAASGSDAPDPGSSDVFLNTDFSTTGRKLINPGPGDPDGYFLRVTYKTKDSDVPSKFTNDIRLPYFNNVTDVLVDEIEFEYL